MFKITSVFMLCCSTCLAVLINVCVHVLMTVGIISSSFSVDPETSVFAQLGSRPD